LTPWLRLKIDPLFGHFGSFAKSSGAAAVVLARRVLGGVRSPAAVGGLPAGGTAEPLAAAPVGVGEQVLDIGDDELAQAWQLNPWHG
jgi:hypothetical protein